MAKSSKPAKPAPKTGTRKKKENKPLTTEELTRKHMEDEDHNITEEEFRDVQITEETPTGEQPPIEGGDERPHDVDKDHRFQTPWDVLNKP